MTDFKALRDQKELIKMREASIYNWRQELEEEKKEDSKPCEKCGKDPCECEDKKGKKAGKHPFVEVMPTSKDGLKENTRLSLKPNTQFREELSVKDQMRISREAAKGRNPNPDHRAIRAKQLKNTKSPKDTRTDAQKMADATGPRKGSNYRGD